ncbi:MAG: hypothetical protein M1813_008843 [Trichoglossum hirsutum]|nr:MAG: hypothetical protein M1813_008843 [Trichoglossum hirsutum]
MEEWLNNKYTSEQLYAWMDGSVRNLFYQTYILANDLAKKAQKAFRFERGSDEAEFINQGYWDTGRDGLLSAEHLYLGLKRMEAAHLEKRNHDFEIVKNISLRQVQPWALIALRESGVAEFSLPEVLFDFDFPGQYCRRIKTLSLTVPCVVGPYTSINATLTLLSHKYCVQGIAANGAEYVEKQPDDPRFRTDQIPISSIAVSHGQGDTGTFTLNFRDERYFPFEGAGVISSWRIELPTTLKHVALRNAASEAALSFQKSVEGVSAADGLAAVFDLKNDYPTGWSLLRPKTAGDSNSQPTSITISRDVRAKSISLLVAAATRLDWTTALTLKTMDTPSVSLAAAGDIGVCQVVTVKDVDEKVGDWELTVTAEGRKAGLEKIVLVFQYTVC